MYILFENLTQKQVDLCALVLSSSGIPYRISRIRNRWDIRVNATQYEQARKAMELYFKENKNDFPAIEPKNISIRQSTVVSGIVAAGILLIAHIAVGDKGAGNEIVNRFSASAVKITDGEYYRAVTALMLHRDEVHLLGNMFGIFIFGIGVCSVTGWGVGWMMVLATGVAGNLLNAFMYQSAHVSIGASTAVFGAIGILAGYQGAAYRSRPGKIRGIFVPLACGLALLGLLGSGGVHVDIMAHLFGFAWGVLIGGLYALFLKIIPGNCFQWLCAAGVLGIVSGAWSLG